MRTDLKSNTHEWLLRSVAYKKSTKRSAMKPGVLRTLLGKIYHANQAYSEIFKPRA
jgi:hypothetical protein